MKESREELLQTIITFLEQGLAENIAAMFRRDPSLYALSGAFARDERLAVRLGAAVLFEELAATRPDEVGRAIPALAPLLAEESPLVRGEAANLLGIIGSAKALDLLRPLRDDPDFQVREIVADILDGSNPTPSSPA